MLSLRRATAASTCSWAERQEKQYPLAEWLTYKQCQEAGGQVRKGEKSTPGIYVNKQVIEKGTDEERLVPFMRAFNLFNVRQCDGLDHIADLSKMVELPEHERNEQAEAFFAAIGATTKWGEPKAAYSPSLDIILMPERGAFLNPESLYAGGRTNIVTGLATSPASTATSKAASTRTPTPLKNWWRR